MALGIDETMVKPVNTGKDDTVVGKVMSGFKYYQQNRAKKWDKMARRCINFYYGDQWDADNKRYLASHDRAPSKFNQILPTIDTIVGHQIQNRIDLVAKPVDRFADVVLADILTSVMKNIEWMNNASFERRFQFLDGLITAVGIKEIWVENDIDLQNVIRVEQKSPWHYYFDPKFEKYDMHDMKKMYKEAWMSKEDIKITFGEKIAKKLQGLENKEISLLPEFNVRPSWDANSTDYGNTDETSEVRDFDTNMKLSEGGYDREQGLYRVIEQYEKKYETIEVLWDEEQKKVVRLEELTLDIQMFAKGKTKKVTKGYIELKTVIADTILAQEADLKSIKNQDVEFYHLFNVFFPYFVNGKYWGAVENLLYPQEDINKHYSQIMHILNNYAQSGVDYEETALAENMTTEELTDLIARSDSAIPWAEGAISGNKVRPRQPHEAPQTLFTLEREKAEQIRYIASTPQTFQGNSKRGESGRARESDINQASMKQLGVLDNFRETHKLEGKAYLFWIQNFYTSEMLVRVLGDEYGQDPQTLMLNMQYLDQIINDVTIGKYDITFEYAAVTQSERDRIKFRLIEMAQANPQFADIIGKWELQYEDIPQKDKILAEWEQRQQLLAQQQQMQMAGGGMPAPNRGPIQSAPRPSRGPRRQPQSMGG